LGKPKKKTRRTKKGAQIEIASFSEWLANRKTLRTKKGARIEFAKFSGCFANRKCCAQRKGARIEDAAHKERRGRYANNYASFSEWLRIHGAQRNFN